MKLIVQPAPHIHDRTDKQRLMLDVVIALLPALIAGSIVFGLRALIVVLSASLAASLSDFLFQKLTKQPNGRFEFSSCVTGMLLGMSLPASVPYWMAAVGGIFAAVAAKRLAGGSRKSLFNPALSARALLMLLVPAALVRFAAPDVGLPLFGNADFVSSATPLHHMRIPALPEVSLLDAFLGNVGGCIGETSAPALLLGGGYLLVRRVISARIPLGYLGTAAVLSLVFAKDGSQLLWMAYSLLGGGLLLGAFFMATDYATSPVTPRGQWFFGIGCGVLTVLLRNFSLYPEGVTYAILLMNVLSRVLDQCTVPRRFGYGKGGACA
ncbi:MAG: RnfABCDGE type electron transport complex subunit D [Clostridia bacterium]|nr:RnfABCDGE type electron transport complex subunit D [Clostridia bacterium]